MEAALDPKLRPMIEAKLPYLPKEYLPVVNAMLRTDPAEFAQVMLGDMDYRGKSAGNEAFCWYYDLSRYSSYVLPLPEDASYQVWVLDTWDITAKKAAEDARGSYKVALPAKKGIAVIAVWSDSKIEEA